LAPSSSFENIFNDCVDGARKRGLFRGGRSGVPFEFERHFSALEGFTEYKRYQLNIGAHPNYHSDGPWFDWVIVKYDIENNAVVEPKKKHAQYMPGVIRDTTEIFNDRYKSSTRKQGISNGIKKHTKQE
jgi:hypothetical protein